MAEGRGPQGPCTKEEGGDGHCALPDASVWINLLASTWASANQNSPHTRSKLLSHRTGGLPALFRRHNSLFKPASLDTSRSKSAWALLRQASKRHSKCLHSLAHTAVDMLHRVGATEPPSVTEIHALASLIVPVCQSSRPASLCLRLLIIMARSMLQKHPPTLDMGPVSRNQPEDPKPRMGAACPSQRRVMSNALYTSSA